jgi:phytoene synthase
VKKLVNKTIYSIFKNGSKTYFYSSVFFPKKVKEDVFVLYSFVRKADDYVDSIPQQKTEFYEFVDKYERCRNGELVDDVVIDSFVDLLERKNFKYEWVDAFLHSMEMDLSISSYNTIEDLKEYLYGSAEVVGLMMAKILGLPIKAYPAARYLGRAMQFINFIRDIDEDIMLGRTYFPQVDLEKFNLSSLEYKYTRKYPLEFKGLIKAQIDRYLTWQEKAENGFRFIPMRYLIPIKTASDMYKWTANQIRKNPYVIYDKKVKPSIKKIVSQVVTNGLTIKKAYKTPLRQQPILTSEFKGPIKMLYR